MGLLDRARELAATWRSIGASETADVLAKLVLEVERLTKAVEIMIPSAAADARCPPPYYGKGCAYNDGEFTLKQIDDPCLVCWRRWLEG